MDIAQKRHGELQFEERSRTGIRLHLRTGDQVQNAYNYYWELDEVHLALDKKMTNAFKSVWNAKKERKIPMHMAAYTVAVARVAEAVRLRGLVK